MRKILPAMSAVLFIISGSAFAAKIFCVGVVVGEDLQNKYQNYYFKVWSKPDENGIRLLDKISKKN